MKIWNVSVDYKHIKEGAEIIWVFFVFNETIINEIFPTIRVNDIERIIKTFTLNKYTNISSTRCDEK